MNYERVNWEDGTLQTGAYVEIDGTQYPVVMPTYSCDTPVTATNLNIMDVGIANATNKEEIPLTITSGTIQQQPLKMYKIGNIINISGIVKGSTTYPVTYATFDKKYVPKSGVFKYVCYADGPEEAYPVVVGEDMYGNTGSIGTYSGENYIQINITYMI